jgi:hypothetical protein
MHGEWIWFIDDDHVWDSKILFALLEHNVDIVGPLYVMRYYPFPPNIFTGQDGQGGYRTASWMELKHQRGLISVTAMGASGLLIRKPVFETLSDPWFEVGKVHPEGLYEDAWFCKKARDAGFSIHADMDSSLGHISTSVLWPKIGGVDIEVAESGHRITMEGTT